MEKGNTKNQTSQNFYEQTADIHNVSERYVRMVVDGKRNNPLILATYETFVFGANRLLEAVKSMVKLD